MALEKEIGASLFIRTTRSVSLTSAGYAFLPYANQITNTYRDFISYKDKAFSKKLVIGSFHSMRPFGIMDIINEYSRKNPDVNIHLIERNGVFLYDYMNHGECDCSFILGYDEQINEFEKTYNILRILTANHVVILPKTHPLATRSELSLHDLEDENIVLLPIKYASQLKNKTDSFLSVIENMLPWISTGIGIGMLVEQEADEQLIDYPELTAVPFVSNDHPILCLIYPQEPTSPYCIDFVKYIADTIGIKLDI
jgi:DNA-binding transcriptional LysR family regulator